MMAHVPSTASAPAASDVAVRARISSRVKRALALVLVLVVLSDMPAIDGSGRSSAHPAFGLPRPSHAGYGARDIMQLIRFAPFVMMLVADVFPGSCCGGARQYQGPSNAP